VVQNAIGGENVTTTVEGRERYPVNVRYITLTLYRESKVGSRPAAARHLTKAAYSV